MPISRFAALSRPVVPENHSGSLQEYHAVEENTAIFDIIKIISQLDPGILCRSAVRIIYLCPAGNAWSHPMAFGIVRNSLRQLVDPKFANDHPDPGDARIPFGSPARAVCLGIGAHTSELQNCEGAAVQSHPLLLVENRPRTLEFDQARRHDQERQRQKEQNHADHNVERTLQELIKRTAAEPVGVEEPTGPERLEIDGPGFALPEIKEVYYLDAGKFAMKQLTHRQAASVVSCNHDLAGPVPIDNLCQSIGLGGRPVDRIGTDAWTLPRHPEIGNRHKMLIFPGFDQPGDACGLGAVAEHDDPSL